MFKLTMSENGDFFYLDNADISEVRESNWLFTSSPTRWRSRDWQAAVRYYEFGDTRSKQALRGYMERIKLSSAQEGDFYPPAPKGMVYEGYQRVGVQWIVNTPNTLLADDPGLGKTAQIMGAINVLNPKLPVLIVCPVTLIGNLIQECKMWLTVKKTVGRTFGYDINICSYEEMKHIPTNARFSMFIVDEAQNLKNAKSMRGRLAKQIAQQSDRRILATGTPMMNRTKDLFHLLNILDGETFNNEDWFKRRYCNVVTSRGVITDGGAYNLTEMQAYLRGTVMIRREKVNALPSVPTKEIKVILLDELGKLPKVYSVQDALSRLDIPKMNLTTMAKDRRALGILKIPYAVTLVQRIIKTRGCAVVFAHHAEVLKQLGEAFAALNPVYITGNMRSEDRQKSILSFQKGDSKLILCSTKAANAGATLTASADTVHVEHDWNGTVNWQAEDRTNRRGQTRKTEHHYLVCNGTIDAYSFMTQQKKLEETKAGLNGNVFV